MTAAEFQPIRLYFVKSTNNERKRNFHELTAVRFYIRFGNTITRTPRRSEKNSSVPGVSYRIGEVKTL